MVSPAEVNEAEFIQLDSLLWGRGNQSKEKNMEMIKNSQIRQLSSTCRIHLEEVKPVVVPVVLLDHLIHRMHNIIHVRVIHPVRVRILHDGLQDLVLGHNSIQVQVHVHEGLLYFHFEGVLCSCQAHNQSHRQCFHQYYIQQILPA